MPSPFPGMDPWLEARSVFPDLHDSLIYLIKKALNSRLPAGYYAIAKTIVWLDDDQRREPDVSVATRKSRPRVGGAAAATVTTLQPLGRPPVPVPCEEGYVEIHAIDGRRLVTAVEVLSRSNKRGRSAGRKEYLKKQREFTQARVNVVEIDLLRAGTHTTASPRQRLERLNGGPFHYHVCVTRAGEQPELFGAVFPLDRPLPAVEILLDAGVAPVTVDLQAALTEAYDAGRYADFVDYAQPCTPPLSPEEQAWADGVLRTRTPTDQRGEK